jgi:hypothetical protein
MPIKGLSTPYPTYPPHFDIEAVIRPNILSLEPYRAARDDYDSGILLDANENAVGHSIPVRRPFIRSTTRAMLLSSASDTNEAD